MQIPKILSLPFIPNHFISTPPAGGSLFSHLPAQTVVLWVYSAVPLLFLALFHYFFWQYFLSTRMWFLSFIHFAVIIPHSFRAPLTSSFHPCFLFLYFSLAYPPPASECSIGPGDHKKKLETMGRKRLARRSGCPGQKDIEMQRPCREEEGWPNVWKWYQPRENYFTFCVCKFFPQDPLLSPLEKGLLHI